MCCGKSGRSSRPLRDAAQQAGLGSRALAGDCLEQRPGPTAKNGMGVLPAFIAATLRSSGTSTPRQIAGRCAWSR